MPAGTSVVSGPCGHTLACRIVDAAGDLRLVQQALGHRSIASTVRYTQVPSEALKAALEAI